VKILFAAVCRPQAQWAQSALDHYGRFLKKYATAEWHWVRAVSPRGRQPDEIRRLESERLLEAVHDIRGFKILCDRTGKALDSESFAQRWQRETDCHGGRAIVILGGAWGVDRTVHDWADLIWSFGPPTYPHELALTIAIEQIARALSILRGDSYHR